LDSLAKLEQNCGSYFLSLRVNKIADSLDERVENVLIILFVCSVEDGTQGLVHARQALYH
jgi:hypothetical protein